MMNDEEKRSQESGGREKTGSEDERKSGKRWKLSCARISPGRGETLAYRYIYV
ncbi:MAG: hypothetical protein NT166_32010 [Candidatus Aminicenantes bacterium]|nr:hypothetical protein [Candidatus Aminicenantes bacterium]